MQKACPKSKEEVECDRIGSFMAWRIIKKCVPKYVIAQEISAIKDPQKREMVRKSVNHFYSLMRGGGGK